MVTASTTYPMELTIDYPDRKLNRLTTFFRPFMVIPIAIILGLIAGAAFTRGNDGQNYQAVTGGLVVLPTVLMILFRKKYPRWWFDWNLALTKFSTRVSAYLMLLRDEYPSTDEEQAVHIDIPYPDAKEELNRWLPLVKWIMAIPHYIVLFFLYIGVLVAVIIAWFAILFTGRYPKSLFDYIVGVLRWSLRVSVYAFLLTTDRYPPFRLGD
ncbi:membrane protein [Peptococcaceae bacterium SCADC1_2_3]|nr:membrane protein [Peptococcaceae bacterium SCADC1_2_3]KFI35077.1 membrane protein [Peptococcaceae bacterium SCADC1_2_3]KFI36757.1 membrane protein [Peptococcaceae bacterium SCADC1_2_3]